MKNTLLIFCLIAISNVVFAQQALTEDYIESDEWYSIYESSGLTVYVQFIYPPSNEICRSNSPITFMYRYKGNLSSSEQYAVWELDYLDCGGITKKMTAYAPMSASCDGWGDYSPGEEFNFRDSDEYVTASELVELRGLNKTVSSYRSPANVGVTLKESFQPSRLTTTSQTVRPGEEITLSVVGGALGEGAFWKLYEGSCEGNFMHSFKERTIRIKPEKTSVYYVLAEGTHNKTNCVEIEITINRSSTPPSSIDGESKVCEGDEPLLIQKGGVLGPDSKWVWYQDACGGQFVGEGPAIQPKLTRNTTFYVRSESNDGTIIGPCLEKSIQVSKRLSDDVEIENKSNTEVICEGTEIILKAKGEPKEGVFWIWKEDNREISRQQEIKRYPTKDTRYKLEMGTVGCVDVKFDTLTIEVYKKSVRPRRITQNFDPDKKNKSVLILEGGYLAEKSEWQWFVYDPSKTSKREMLESGKPAVSGRKESISVEKGWKDNAVFVIASGDYCEDRTDALDGSESIQLKEKSKRVSSGSFSTRYGTDGRWFHFGIQAGFDYFNIKDSLSNVLNSSDKQAHNIQSLAYFIGGELHPVFLDQFYLGVHGGYGQFFKDYLNYPQLAGNTDGKTETGNGKMTYLGGEMGWTISREHAAKMFVRYTRTGFNNNLTVESQELDPISGIYVQNRYQNLENIVIDRMSFGFRFGAFDVRGKTNSSGKTKLGRPFDFMINLHNRDNIVSSEMFSDFSSFSKFKDWKLGFELAYWKHNVFRIGFNMGFNSSFKEMTTKGNDFLPDYFIARLAYNFDLFR